MKLTKREKLLLLVLLAIMMIVPYVHYVIMPQTSTLKMLKSQMNDYELTLDESKNMISSKEIVNATYEQQSKALQAYHSQYMKKLEQGTILFLFNEIISSSGVDIASISFSEFQEKQLEEIVVNSYSVQLYLSGDYESLVKFLELVRKNERQMIVKDLELSQENNNTINCKIMIEFYELIDGETISLANESPFMLKKYFENVSPRLSPFSKLEAYKSEYFNGAYEVAGIEDQLFLEVHDLSPDTIQSSATKKEKDQTKLLYDFKAEGVFFIGEPRSIIGKISSIENNQHGEHIVKIDYDFLRPRKQSIANLVFEGEPIRIEKQPKQIGLSIYAFEKGTHRIAIMLRDSHGKQQKILLVHQIDWHGWKTVGVDLPLDIAYPTVVERILIEGINYDNKTKGVLLFHQLEAIYFDYMTDLWEEK